MVLKGRAVNALEDNRSRLSQRCAARRVLHTTEKSVEVGMTFQNAGMGPYDLRPPLLRLSFSAQSCAAAEPIFNERGTLMSALTLISPTTSDRSSGACPRLLGTWGTVSGELGWSASASSNSLSCK